MLSDIKKLIQYSAFRHNVLSSNVANINTPGYVAKDVLPFNISEYNKKVRLKTTSPMHITNSAAASFNTFHPRDTEVKIDGNNVSVESETLKLSKNDFEHKKAIEMYNKIISLAKIAVQNDKRSS